MRAFSTALFLAYALTAIAIPIIGSDEGSVNRRTEGGSRPPPDWKRADRPPPGWKRLDQPPPGWKRTEGGSTGLEAW
ncbi:hypothetical protein C8J57DRAFT_229776 [Mycena rebaudengoi]|nr:hypothetical protein C8J57DRAFT_229776 [Mycena rebaudengoi]